MLNFTTKEMKEKKAETERQMKSLVKYGLIACAVGAVVFVTVSYFAVSYLMALL